MNEPGHMSLQTEDDIYLAQTLVRNIMKELRLSEMDRQMVLVSVAELTRNVLLHAGGRGSFWCECIPGGVRVTVTDQGRGIPHVDKLLLGEFVTSSQGLGLGLAGVHRLMDDVQVETSEKGSKIVATKWASNRAAESRASRRPNQPTPGFHW